MTALCYPRDVKPRRLLISGGADCTIRVWDLMYAFSSSCFLHFSKYFGVSFLCVCVLFWSIIINLHVRVNVNVNLYACADCTY